MATNRTRRTRGRVGADGLTEGAYYFFSSGPFFEGEDWVKEKSEEEIESFWKAHRREIMDRFMADIRRKGKSWEGDRPEFFWREIKEPRLKTGTREYYKPWPDREKHIEDVYETDVEFLARLGLLEAWEKELQ